MPKSVRILTLTALLFLNVFGEKTISFDRDIQPILSENCYYCHGTDPKHREGDLRLDLREDALDVGAIVPEKPEKSELIDRIHSKDPDDPHAATGFKSKAHCRAKRSVSSMDQGRS